MKNMDQIGSKVLKNEGSKDLKTIKMGQLDRNQREYWYKMLQIGLMTDLGELLDQL